MPSKRWKISSPVWNEKQHFSSCAAYFHAILLISFLLSLFLSLSPCSRATLLCFNRTNQIHPFILTSSAFFQFAKTWWSVACTNKPPSLYLYLCLSLKFSHYLCLASSVNIYDICKLACVLCPKNQCCFLWAAADLYIWISSREFPSWCLCCLKFHVCAV